jgi:tetratricopeptide (TPR) repeat protein
MRRFAICILLTVVPLMVLSRLSIPTARAEPAGPDQAKLQKAKSYVDAGLAAQNAGDYDTAITFYSQAYALVSHPVLLFDIAQAHRLAGRMSKAENFYRDFLAASPALPEAQIARDLLAEIEKRKVEEARRAERSSMRANGSQAEEALESGEAQDPGQASPDVQASSTAGVLLPAPVEGRADTVWSTRRKIAVGTAIGGGLALAVGGAFGISARNDQRDVLALCPQPQLVCDNADRASDSFHSAHTRVISADVAFGVGAAAMITAGVLWFTGAPTLHHHIAIAPSASSGQALITMSGGF